MPSFDDFLRFGRLGHLATGLTKNEVKDLLGEPLDTSLSTHPEIWKYGPLELAFYRRPERSSNVLTSISYKFTDDETTFQGLMLDGWLPTHKSSFSEVRTHLDDVGIPVFGGVTAPPRQHLVLGSAVRMTFDEGRLATVGFTAKAVETSERKQFSVSVPLEDWLALNREAKARGISASALSSLWISEQVSSLKAHS